MFWQEIRKCSKRLSARRTAQKRKELGRRLRFVQMKDLAESSQELFWDFIASKDLSGIIEALTIIEQSRPTSQYSEYSAQYARA